MDETFEIKLQVGGTFSTDALGCCPNCGVMLGDEDKAEE